LREAERSRAEAEAAGKAKDHFLAVLSHELRTPLTPVLMAVDILSRSQLLDPAAREALDMIRHNVELEADFIKDLLDVTRIGRGKFEITRAPVDFHDVIRRAIGVSKHEIEYKEQRLTVTMDAMNQWVEGDFGRLQQVVWNLLKNASKFTPESGEIRVHTRNSDRRIVLEVTDTGIGIQRDALSRIFEPFTQENPGIAGEFGGLGLGLTIARAVIDAHGGEMHAHSAGRDQGSTFSVILLLCTQS
jgi:signal transduction histidine kinase